MGGDFLERLRARAGAAATSPEALVAFSSAVEGLADRNRCAFCAEGAARRYAAEWSDLDAIVGWAHGEGHLDVDFVGEAPHGYLGLVRNELGRSAAELARRARAAPASPAAFSWFVADVEFLAEQSPDVFPTQGDRDRYMSLWDGCELVNALFLAECERDPSGVPYSWGGEVGGAGPRRGVGPRLLRGAGARRRGAPVALSPRRALGRDGSAGGRGWASGRAVGSSSPSAADALGTDRASGRTVVRWGARIGWGVPDRLSVGGWMEARDGRGGAVGGAPGVGPCPVTDGCVTQPSEHDARERLGEARALAQDGDDGHLGGLAASCIDLASLLGERDPAEAEALYREALPLWQSLEARHPGEFLGDVARTRADLAFLLMGRDPAEARVLFREVLSDLRPLAAGDPGEFLPCLARACDNLAALLQWDGLAGEAEALSREALSAWRDLAASDPAEFLPCLARSCDSRAFFLKGLDRVGEAEDLLCESISAWRDLAAGDPGEFLPRLADSCGHLASLLEDAGDLAGAEAPHRESIFAWEALASSDPGAALPGLADSRTDLAELLWTLDRVGEAEGLLRGAVSAWRELGESDPGGFLPGLAGSCNNLAVFLEGVGRRADAEAPMCEALSLWRDLAAGDPGEFLPELARACSNMAFLLERDRPWEAEALYREALSTYEALARAGPGREDYRRRAGQARARLERMADPSA